MFPLRLLLRCYLYSNKKYLSRYFYNVGNTPGPIGRPIMYHPTISSIQVAPIIKKYGVNIFKDFLIVIGFCLFKLYKFRYPIYITNDANIGVYPFVIEFPTLIAI